MAIKKRKEITMTTTKKPKKIKYYSDTEKMLQPYVAALEKIISSGYIQYSIFDLRNRWTLLEHIIYPIIGSGSHYISKKKIKTIETTLTPFLKLSKGGPYTLFLSVYQIKNNGKPINGLVPATKLYGTRTPWHLGRTMS